MSAAPNPTQTDDPASPTPWESALLDRQLERLDKLADMGMALAAEIQRRATTAALDADITHAAIDFARVSRAVRMTLALQSKLVRDFKTPIKAGSGKADNDGDGFIDFEAYWDDGTPITTAAQKRVLRETVESLAKDCGLETETAKRMETEALEALEREPVYPAPGNRPFRKFVAQICEDLGLNPGDLPSFAAAIGESDQSPAIDEDGPLAERTEERLLEAAGQAHPASAWFDVDSS